MKKMLFLIFASVVCFNYTANAEEPVRALVVLSNYPTVIIKLEEKLYDVTIKINGDWTLISKEIDRNKCWWTGLGTFINEKGGKFKPKDRAVIKVEISASDINGKKKYGFYNLRENNGSSEFRVEKVYFSENDYINLRNEIERKLGASWSRVTDEYKRDSLMEAIMKKATRK